MLRNMLRLQLENPDFFLSNALLLFQFVAHPHCQQALDNSWYRGLPEWVCRPDLHTARMSLYGLLIFLSFPVLVPLYMLRIPAVDRFLKPPAGRFLS